MSGKKALLAGAIFLSSIVAYNCGGGGGTTTTSSTLDVYLTDAPVDARLLSSLEITLYKIDLCRDGACTDTINVFTNTTGVTVDLTQLEGVLHYIDSSSVPPEEFQAIKVEVSKDGNLIYEGNSGTFSLQTGGNITCDDATNKCTIVVNGAVNPALNNKLLIDFDLRNFQIDCNTAVQPIVCTIDRLTIIAKPETSQTVTSRYKFEMYAIVDPQTITEQNRFTFQWRNRNYTAEITQDTVCEINDRYFVGTSCVTELQNFTNPVCLELKMLGDPANSDQIQQVIEFETKNPKKCGYEDSEYYSDDSNDYYMEIKGIFQGIRIDDQTNEVYIQVSVGGVTKEYKLMDTTYCEIDDVYEEDKYFVGVEKCRTALENLQNSSTGMNLYVEVKYDPTTNEAYKVDIEYYEDDDYTNEDEYTST